MLKSANLYVTQQMRIAIDIRSTLKSKTGIGYYSLNLIQGLCGLDKDNRYLLYSRKGFFSRDKILPALPGKNFRHRVDYFNQGPSRVLGRVDIWHTSSLDISVPQGAKAVLVVHDCIHKACALAHSQDTRDLMDARLGAALGNFHWIITDSQTTYNDLVSFYNYRRDSISVVYPGVSRDFFPQPNKEVLKDELSRRYQIGRDFILCVSTLEPRKNIPGLLKAYQIVKQKKEIDLPPLVLVGMKGWGYEEIFSLAKELDLEKHMHFLGYVPYAELNLFYNACCLFVYPSFYEGAGLPVLEAMACGCAVITSHSSSLLELAGDACMLIDPASPLSIAQALERLLRDGALRNEFSERGIRRASQFSWEDTARKTLEVFNRL